MYSLVKFNLKPVSDSVNQIIVNNATMQLTLKNPLSAIGFESVDSVVAYLAGSPTQFDTVGPAYFAYGYRKDTTQTTNSVFIFNLTSMVQYWINTRATILAPSCVQSAAPPMLTSTSLFFQGHGVCSTAHYHIHKETAVMKTAKILILLASVLETSCRLFAGDVPTIPVSVSGIS